MRRAVAATLLLLLVACRAERGEDPREAVRASVAKTLAAGSARVALSCTLNAAHATGEGVRSFVSDDASMNVSGTTGLLDVRAELRTVSGRYYTKVGRSNPWQYWPDPGKAVLFLRTFDALGRFDAEEAVRWLGGVTDATRGAAEDVRGVATRRYEGTLDLARVEGTAAAVDRLGTSRAAFTVWLDAEGRVRRVTLGVDADRLVGSSERGTMSVTFELFEFGVRVALTPPAKVG